MVEPCDKYQGLVRGPDGQTVADPYGMIPTLGDYEEWYEVAGRLVARAEKELKRERDLVGPANMDPADVATVAALRQSYADMGGALWQLLAPDDVTWGPSIVRVVELAREAACQIGVIEARVVAQGGSTSVAPTGGLGGGKGTGKATGKGMGLGFVVALGLLAWYQGSKGGDQ